MVNPARSSRGKVLMRAIPLRAAAGRSSKRAARCAAISTFISATTPVSVPNGWRHLALEVGASGS